MIVEDVIDDLIQRFGSEKPASLLKEIWRSVHAFARNEPFHDDVTMVAVRRKQG